MLTNLFRSICQVGIFMICAQAIVHFRPKADYEKYLKILVSVMIFIQIFLPISSVFSKEGQTDILTKVEEFEQRLKQISINAESSALASERLAETFTARQLEELRKESEEQENREQESEEQENQTQESREQEQLLQNKKAGQQPEKVKKIQIKVGQG